MAESALAKVPTPVRFVITFGLCVLAGVAYYVLFYSEVATAIEQTISARAQLESDLKAAKQAEADYQRDLEELARRRERERELNKVLPAKTEVPAFLSAVQSVANMAGVELTAWNPQPEQKEDFYVRVPMKVSLRGKFHQIAKFFYGIGQNDRIMNIEDISIKTPVVKDGEIMLAVDGLATAFCSLPVAEAGPTGQDKRGAR